MRILGVILLCLSVNLSYQRSTEADDSYIAAVLEYAFDSNATINLQNYIQFIQDAATQNADIIVFPEMTLTRGNYIEVPMKSLLLNNPIPALAPQLYHSILVDLSKAAMDYQIYVVVNINEVMNCTTDENGEYCPESKLYYFNTNIVLDRNGAVIDRYRKINLFGEPGNTPALNPDLGLFTTDFGVTFGHFICFDLMFQVPAIQVVQKNNITDVIFTTMWFSELPYLTAVEIQEAYAYSLGINFLASGANNVRVGSAGSGIYSGKAGALISIMPGVPTTSLLVTQVPKVPGNITDFPGPIHGSPADADSLYLKRDPSIQSHVTRLLQEGSQTVSISNNDVSCSFKVNLTYGSTEPHYYYRATAFDGVRTFDGVATGGSQVCSIIACNGTDVSTCGVRYSEYENNNTAIFHELSMTASVPAPVYVSTLSADDAFFVPISLDVTTLPLSPEEYNIASTIEGDRKIFSMSLINTSAEIYSFGVWGRKFERDEEEATAPSSNHYDATSDIATDASSRHFIGFTLLTVLFLIILR